MTSISCVICAYNEAPRIGTVLQAAVGHPYLSEIIVVDDGSTDGTADVVRTFPSVKLISYTPNRGKSHALKTGMEAVKGDLVMYLDADLRDFTPENITALAEPVLSGRADMSISVRKNSLSIYRAIGLDFVSGERVISRQLVSEIIGGADAPPPFGIEVYMNERIVADNLRIAVVWFENVINTRKSEKIGFVKGTLKDLGSVIDVLKVISPWQVIRQNYRMLAQSREFERTRLSANAFVDASHE